MKPPLFSGESAETPADMLRRNRPARCAVTMLIYDPPKGYRTLPGARFGVIVRSYREFQRLFHALTSVVEAGDWRDPDETPAEQSADVATTA